MTTSTRRDAERDELDAVEHRRSCAGRSAKPTSRDACDTTCDACGSSESSSGLERSRRSRASTALAVRVDRLDRTLHEFARENLFDPLGLGPTEWATGRDGEPFAASGARMSVRDLARIGVMMLRGGKLGERTIVPADWVTRCVTPAVGADEVRRYGYQWFLIDIAFGKPKGWAVGRLERMWIAQGEGGQRLFIIPALELVIAITAGNYGREDQGRHQPASCARLSWIAFNRDAAVTADFDTWGHLSDRSGAVVGPWPAECCPYTRNEPAPRESTARRVVVRGER